MVIISISFNILLNFINVIGYLISDYRESWLVVTATYSNVAPSAAQAKTTKFFTVQGRVSLSGTVVWWVSENGLMCWLIGTGN